MTILRKREKENRRDRRQEVRLILNYQNTEFKIIDISLGGISISGETSLFSELQEIEATLKDYDSKTSEKRIDISLIVKRINKERNEAALQFKSLSEHQFSILEKHLTGRL